MNDQKKTTIYDLAELTGFSVGTVNRALNGKGRIKQETRQLILDAAKKTGYRANPAAQGLRRNPLRLGAVLYCPVAEYVNDIYAGICAAAQNLEKYNVTVDIHLLPYTTNEHCRQLTLQLLQRFEQEKVSGVLLFHSSVNAQLAEICQAIDRLTEGGIPVVSIGNELPACRRLFHVGADTYMAGQMAAELLQLTCRGRDVAVLTGSLQQATNRRYVEGFTAYAGTDTFTGIQVYTHHDESDLIQQQTARMLTENPALAGVYMATASSVAACEYLAAQGRTDLQIITTDLLAGTPQLLQSGIAIAAIFQDPYRQGKAAVQALYEYLTAKKEPAGKSIVPSVILASNVQAYLDKADNR